MNTKSMIISLVLSALLTSNAVMALELSENCIVNILNRTIQVSKGGGWALPNLPSNMGKIKARATCTLEDGTTISGHSNYFTIANNAITKSGEIEFEDIEPIPSEIDFTSAAPLQFDGIGKTFQIKVMAKYADGSEKDVTASEAGTTYTTTNPATATISPEGLITAKGNGNVLINASKDGVLASIRVSVSTSGDLDKDGIPDDWEIANGLNPADTIDAFEDKDTDKLSNLDEYKEGTNPSLADTDGDGIDEFKELKQTKTSPLLADTDGDGLNDNVELLTNTDPLKSSSANYAAAVQSISVTPPTLVLTFSGVDTEVSTQLKVTGKLVDGSTLDLTSKSRGTTYTSNNLAVVNFGTEDGKVFGGQSGNAIVTIANGNLSIPMAITVESFTPSALSAIDIPGYANNVDVAGDLAFIAAGSTGLQVVDVSNRKTPKIIGKLDTDGNAIDLRVRGNLVFIADGEMGLKIIDVTVPQEPKLIAQLDTAGITQDIQIYGNYAYLANGDAGIEIIDITDATAPTSVGSLSTLGTVKGVDVEGNILSVVTGSSLVTIDVEDKRSPVKVGGIYLGAVQDLDVNAGFAHVAAYSNGYRVVDIRDPANLKVTGGDAVIAPRDVELTNGLAFYAEQLFPNVVAYINIEDPIVPVFQGTINLSSFGDYAGTGIALDASYAYITEESYFVSQNFGTTSNTRLFIAQYRMLNDVAGVAPATTLVYPSDGQIIVENKSVLVSAAAQDDVAVKNVEFWVDDILVGTDTTTPYEITYKLPAEKRFIKLKTTASDFGGNKSDSTTVRINIQPDKDKDGLGNEDEADNHETDPNNADTDSDGLLDGREIAIGTNPLNKDSDSDTQLDASEVLNGTDPLNPDTTPPSITQTYPVNGAKEVPMNKTFNIAFDESIKPSSIYNGITLYSENNQEKDVSVKLINENEIQIRPTTNLLPVTKYTLDIRGIRDLAGNSIKDNIKLVFVTATDAFPPKITSIIPTDDSRKIPTNTTFYISLDEPVDTQSANSDGIWLTYHDNGKPIPAKISVAENGTTIEVEPQQKLRPNEFVSLKLKGLTDLAGNTGRSISFEYPTAFDQDSSPPTIVSNTFSGTQTNIPLNTRIRVLFDESIKEESLQNISLYSGGIEIPAIRILEGSNKLAVIKPISLLSPNTIYELNIGKVEDTSQNTSREEKTITFTTGVSSDTTADTLASSFNLNTSSGFYYLTGVSTNSTLEIKASDNIDPTTLLEENIFIERRDQSRLEGTISSDAENKLVQFSPKIALSSGHTYKFTAKNITDLAGNPLTKLSIDFITGNGNDTTPPTVKQSNFPNDSEQLPTNVQLALQFSEPLNYSCVNTKTIQVIENNSGERIPGTSSLLPHTNTIIFTPTIPLNPSTDYIFTTAGICDAYGNAAAPYSIEFTTGDNLSADNQPPQIVKTTPNSDAADVDTSSEITITFNENIDATQLSQLQITGSDMGEQIAGTWSATNNILVFKALGGLPSQSTISAYLYGIKDLAGNQMISSTFRFTVGVTKDTTPPEIRLITPSNGAMNVGTAPIEITFSESIATDTINADNFVLIIDGTLQRPNIYHSIDNKVVSLYTSLIKPDQTITVVATSGVTDLAGNTLAEFASTFNTPAEADDPRYSTEIIWQIPTSSGHSTKVPNKIILQASKLIDADTLNNGFYAIADGAVIQGTSKLDNTGRRIEFTPTTPLPEDSLIEIFATEHIRDLQGNRLRYYEGSFTTNRRTDSTEGTKPILSMHAPSGYERSALNPLTVLSFSEPLNPATINVDRVQLRKQSEVDSSIEEIVPTTIKVSDDRLHFSVKPTISLTAGSRYSLCMTGGITDIDGDNLEPSCLNFRVNNDATYDKTPPKLLISNPAEGDQNVYSSQAVHLRFDKSIIPTSLPKQDYLKLLIRDDGKDIWYTKDQLFKAGADQTESIAGITDTSGNILEKNYISFKTNVQELLQSSYGFPEEINSTFRHKLPTNGELGILFDEDLDQASILNNINLYEVDQDNRRTIVDTTYSLSDNARLLTIKPKSELKPNQQYVLKENGLGTPWNPFAGFFEILFSTNSGNDIQPPSVASINIDEGQTGLPLNTKIRFSFDEIIDVHHLEQGLIVRSFNTHTIQSTAGGEATLNGDPIRVKWEDLQEDSRSSFSIPPINLLKPNTYYELIIKDFRDLSGNIATKPFIRHFTTGSSVDTKEGYETSRTPSDRAENISTSSTIKITFSKPLDQTSINNVTLWPPIDLTQELDDTRKILTLTPRVSLSHDTTYSIEQSWVSDMTGSTIVIKPTSFHTQKQ